ncbi:uracil-xanthine permease family protein [Bacillus sp. JCM 19034]|uniref:uracil-xanthine permease family protein n=1 Tax=Bacillus sp. JCM 19034 TaxID=1481928 RepID=UPI0007847EFB|nr:solute carrier family 23 protein [Bacillus sp. JCM 19034]
MNQEKKVLQVGIEDQLSKRHTLAFGVQHLLGLTGIFLFPVLIGQAMGLETSMIGYLIQACFITTGIVTVLQSGKMLKLPVVQGPTAVFFAILLSVGLDQGLGTAFGSMMVAGMIMMLLSIPIKKWGLMAYVVRFVSPPLVYGTLLVIIGAQLAEIGLSGWFGVGGTTSINFFAALVTVLAVIILMVVGGNTILRRGSVLLGIIIGTIFYSIIQPISMTAVNEASWVGLPQLFPFGFSISIAAVGMFLLAFLHASAESVGMYNLLGGWSNQEISKERANRGLFGEFFGCTIGAIFGGLGTTSYPENIGIIRVTGIGSRYVTYTAGIVAIIIGFIPKIGILIASIPGSILSGASTILFGVIALSGIQMLSTVKWDDLNLTVAATAFIISLGTMHLPADIVEGMPYAVRSIVAEPMLVGLILLVGLNIIVNLIIRPRLEKETNDDYEKTLKNAG